MDTVYFITPNNEHIAIKYNDLFSFCKLLCYKEENKEKFLEFQKDYTYFYPYFDFVVFELNYLFSNDYPYFYGKAMGALFKNPIFKGERYKDYLKRIERQSVADMPWLTKCSDTELRIGDFPFQKVKESLVDINLQEMMSYSGTVCGSHYTTGNTIMNQLMMRDEFIRRDFLAFEDFSEESKALNYLIKRMGIIQVTGDLVGTIIYNECSIEKEQSKVIDYCENRGFDICAIEEEENQIYTSHYQKILRNR